jgi:hypothetical protein
MSLRRARSLAACLLTLPAIFSLTVEAAAQPGTNKQYCARNGTNLVFVIDVTTEYDEKDRQLLLRAVGEIFDSLHGGERLVIRTITSSFSTSDRLVDACMPTCRAKGVIEKLFSCSDGQIVADTKAVKRDIIRSLRERLEHLAEEPRSDIVRTLAQVSREELLGGDRKVLYLFSDLIENSEHVTMRLFFDTDNRRLIGYFKRYNLIAALKGVDVRAFGVGRSSAGSRSPLSVARYQKLVDFWNLYFTSAQAASVEISQNIVERGP